MVRVILDPEVAFLTQDDVFKKKLQAAFEKSHGWSFRVFKKGLGWIEFSPDGNQVYHGYVIEPSS